MGFNPYMCIICGIVEDNGWGYGIFFYDKIKILENQGYEFKCLKHEKSINGYLISSDIRDRCFLCKGPSIKDPFFNVKRTKQKIIEYWKYHNKKIKIKILQIYFFLIL